MLELNKRVKVLGTGLFGGREGVVTKSVQNKDGSVYFGLALSDKQPSNILFWFKEHELLPLRGEPK